MLHLSCRPNLSTAVFSGPRQRLAGHGIARFWKTQPGFPGAYARKSHSVCNEFASRRLLCTVHCQQSNIEPAPTDIRSNGSNPTLDAIVVLGGGLKEQGGIPLWGQKRLITANELYKQQGSSIPVLCLGGGTPHKPAVLSGTGHVIHEASAYAAYLAKKGIPAKHLLKEVSSYDTVGNAYFAFAIHALPADWRRLAVVTSAFHMPRSEAIFRHCASLAASRKGKREWFQLTFHAAPDEGVFEEEVLAARHEREQESLQTWLNNSKRLETLKQLHAFLHQEHACYAVAHQAAFGEAELDDINDKALASY